MFSREIRLKGHLIDSLIMTKVLDKIVQLGGDFDILEFKIGKTNRDHSQSKILVKAKNQKTLANISEELTKLGAVFETVRQVELKKAPKDGVLPEDFYSTTNHPTQIHYKNRWISVADPKMDCAIVVDPKKNKAETKKMLSVKKGQLVVVGSEGIKVTPPEKPRKRSQVFEFMSSSVSSEKPAETLIQNIVEEIKELKKRGKKIAIVAGPAVIHTGAGKNLASLINKKIVDLVLTGNALAVHDLEEAIYGTSLGRDIATCKITECGHRNHLRAINKIREAGGIKKAVDKKIVKTGVMHALVKNKTPYSLAGSIRDDGPLPEVITDVVAAQKDMMKKLKNVDLVLMMASTLHSIAAGNLLPSKTKVICVDINPAVVTKLTDRGTGQAVGIVSDVGLFLESLDKKLK